MVSSFSNYHDGRTLRIESGRAGKFSTIWRVWELILIRGNILTSRNCLHTICLNDKSYIAAEASQHATFIWTNILFMFTNDDFVIVYSSEIFYIAVSQS